MKNRVAKLTLLSAFLLLTTLGVATTSRADVRYCCTTQQIQSCAAIGGTTSCRTNVCQCLF